MKYSISTILVIGCFTLAAQNEPFVLSAGSPDGIRWSFLWTPRSVPANLNAFVLKRRRANERRWTNVTEPISFELSATKSYANLNLTPEMLAAMQDEISGLFSSGRLKQIDNQTLVADLADANKLRDFQIGTGINYNVARAAGLGCDDPQVENAVSYEYGLFLVINQREQSRPAATVRVTGGEKFFFNRISDFNVRIFTSKSSVQLLWKADQQTLNLIPHRGFNVYRRQGSDWVKINQASVIQRDSEGFYAVYDSNASATEVNEYSIRLISIFNFEDSDNIFRYDPNEIIDKYEKPEIKLIEGNLPYEQGTIVNFQIPDAIRRHIDRFEILRSYPPGEFVRIGTLTDPNSTSFNDKGPLIPKEYYVYRVKVVYKDKTEIFSDDVMLYYLPKIIPPRPRNLRATVRSQNRRTFVTLEWDKGSDNDTITQEFYIYASSPLTNEIHWVNFEESIKETRFVYEIHLDQGASYRFCVSSLGRYMYESEPSDTITVKVPTKLMPTPIVKKWEVDSSAAIIHWDYPNIDDLKGFRLYRDGMLIITENDLPADRRSFNTGPMRYFTQYKFEIEAISHDGLASTRSIPIEIITEQRKRQTPTSN